jgi:hypothetical protein
MLAKKPTLTAADAASILRANADKWVPPVDRSRRRRQAERREGLQRHLGAVWPTSRTTGFRIATWLARRWGQRALLRAVHYRGVGRRFAAAAVVQAPDVDAALQQAATSAGDVGSAGAALETAASSGDDAGTLTAYLGLGSALSTFYAALNELEDAIDDNVTPATVPNAAERAGGRGLRRRNSPSD